MEHHELYGGRLHVYKRDNSRYWQCSTYLAGKNRRVSTKEESLSLAKEFAEDWYLGLKGKHRSGDIKGGKTFRYAAEQFQREYEIITQGHRSPKYVEGQKDRIRVHLLPYFGPLALSEITPGGVQEYRIHRAQTSRTGRPPARSTLHQEIVALRQILKTAQRHGWIQYVPDLSPPYKASGKISHRAWFSPDEYRRLYEATRKRAGKPLNNRWRWSCEQLHDYVLFMANTGLRPDEAARLEYRDVKVVRDAATAETILEIEVRGKRGVGFCKSTSGAVRPFLRLRKRNNPKPTDPLFPGNHRILLNNILDELELKEDRDGNRRTAYSLRHTYICLRLMEGADIYQIAKNCRTSVEMIEKYYAAHIKNTLDAAAINVRRSRPAKSRRPRKPKASTNKLDDPA
ncbi:MAG: site-specific integrase [Planctomycetes bacterium]|nr:site-specific integrase [Planctomycetota bacterium]RIK71134.1 MAG: integrase [Planctomycetota bacterium]